ADGIQKAFISSIEAIFYDEPHLANEILFSQIENFPQFLPVAVINPNLANWDKNLNKYHSEHNIKAIKLHPNYHLYKLNDSNVKELLISAGEKNITVIIQMRVQDVRSQNPICIVQDVDVSSVIEIAETIKETRFVFGGIKWNEVQGMANRIKFLSNAWVDISNIEYIDVLRRLINVFGTDQILFGTHSPFFEVKSAILKLKEANLTNEEFKSITSINAKKAFSIL
ncbi:MAG: amidohydrolase family protein, partial [Candidatus Poribacteria bacterium]